jgi:hypothetical protein
MRYTACEPDKGAYSKHRHYHVDFPGGAPPRNHILQVVQAIGHFARWVPWFDEAM